AAVAPGAGPCDAGAGAVVAPGSAAGAVTADAAAGAFCVHGAWMPSNVACGFAVAGECDVAMDFAASAAGDTVGCAGAAVGSGCTSQPIVTAPGCCGRRAPEVCDGCAVGSGCASQPIVNAPGCGGRRAPPTGCDGCDGCAAGAVGSGCA